MSPSKVTLECLLSDLNRGLAKLLTHKLIRKEANAVGGCPGKREPMADTLPASQREVTRSDQTLVANIEVGNVPKPGLMLFNPWQTWRSQEGKRPKAVTDGRSTTSSFEVTLWKATMRHYYGEDWQADATTAEALALAAEEEAEEEAAAAEAAAHGVEARGQQSSSLRSASDPVASAAQEPQAASPRQPTPYVGQVGPPSGRLSPASLLASRPGSPGSEGGSSGLPGFATTPPPSFHSSSPGTPRTLLRKVLQDYDPRKEPLAGYEARVQRQCTALRALGEPVPLLTLGTALAKARYLLRMSDPDMRNDPHQQVKYLQQEYAFGLVEEDSGLEQTSRLAALGQLLTERQVDCGELAARVQAEVEVVTPSPLPLQAPSPQETACARAGCPKPASGISKYCSQDCMAKGEAQPGRVLFSLQDRFQRSGTDPEAAAAGAEHFYYGTEQIGSPRGPTTPEVQELQRRLEQAKLS